MVNTLRPGGLAATVVALMLAAVAVGLGLWQLGRASEKQSIMDLRSVRDHPVALGQGLPWRAGLQPGDLDQQRVVLTGRWLPDASVALDNRAWQGRPGVHVLTPLVLSDGSMVWVNRGWMPKAPAAPLENIPQPASEAAFIEGVALASVMRRIELSSDPASLRQGNLWQNFDWAAAADRVSNHAWPVIVWQTSDNGDGLMRSIPELKSDVPKHLGYALQWFLLALAALVFAWRLRPQRGL
jgi:surfeit locus 1 family protein